jgi:hypothetical protein
MFVWYSNLTKDSGQAIANALGCEHGTVPPQGYEGDVLCFGAAPADNFNWGQRAFKQVVNDPRKFRKYKDKDSVSQVLGGFSSPVRIFWLKDSIVGIVNTVNNQPVDVGNNLNNLTVVVQSLVEKLDSPDFVAFDGYLNGSNFLVSNVVFGPALLNQPGVIQKLVDVYDENPDDFLNALVNNGTKEEKKALVNILRKMKKELAA